MDIVYIRDLKIETVIGIYDWERKIKQTIRIDLDMGFDLTAAAASDNIDDTLDYKAVAKRLIAFVEVSSFYLVETIADRIAQIVINEFGVKWLKLTLSKPEAVTGSSDVGVIIERGEKF